MKTKVNAGAKGKSSSRDKTPDNSMLSLCEIKELLDKKDIDGKIKEEIVKELGNYPEGALRYAWKNIDSIITRISLKMTQ